MLSLFQELDHRGTDVGALIPRRWWEARLGEFIHEIELGEDFGVTLAVTASELALGGRGPDALA